MSARVRLLLSPGFYVYVARRLFESLRQLGRDYANRRPLPARRLSIASGASLGRGVILAAEPGIDDADPARIEIGDRAYVEDGVELGLTPGSRLVIGRNTSIHRGCVILGNVRIGANCVFSYNVYVSAGTHVVNERPAWLIKDQDDAFAAARPRETVWIDDDAWIGWGVFIRSGAHVGRGAVIGANAVVNSDVEPYAIYAGVPARKIGQRLDFKPPAEIEAIDDACLPYFYSGFLDDQASLLESRKQSVIRLAGASRIVLGAPTGGVVRLRGLVADGDQAVVLRISVGGNPTVEERLGPGPFELSVRLQSATADSVPPQLRAYTVVELDPGADAHRIAIRSVALSDRA